MYEGSAYNHPFLETQLVSSSDGLARLDEITQREHKIRFSYWKNNSQERWLADMSPLFDIPDSIHNKEVFLYVDIIDKATGIPVAWGASKILFKDDDHHSARPVPRDTLVCFTTGDAIKCSISLRLTNLALNFKYELQCSVMLECSVVFGRGDRHLVRPHPQSSIEWMKKVYPRGESVFITVEDLLLSPDITEVYGDKAILVRATGSEGKDRGYLGSVQASRGNWMECIELFAGHNPEHVGIEVLTLSLKDGRWVESLICQGELLHEHRVDRTGRSKRARLSSGVYECKLSTPVRTTSGAQSAAITVGKARLRLVVDSGKITIPYSQPVTDMDRAWIKRETQALASSSEPLRVRVFKAVYLLGLVEVEDFSRKVENLQLVDALLAVVVQWYVWASHVFEDMATFVVQLQLQQRLLFVLNLYFEDWLTSEFLQELIALAQLPADAQTAPAAPSNMAPGPRLEDETKGLDSLEKALACLSLAWVLHSEWGTSFSPPEGGMTAQFVGEIAADLLQPVLSFKLQFMKKLLTGPTASHESQLQALTRLQDLEAFLHSFHKNDLQSMVDEYHLACSCVELKYLIQTLDALGQDLTSQSVQHRLLLRCTAQQISSLSRYMDRLAARAQNATTAVRLCSSHLQFLDVFCVLIRRMVATISRFTEFLTVETVLTNALSAVRGIFCRSINITHAPLVHEDGTEEAELEKLSVDFRALTAYLEMGQMAAERRSMRLGEFSTSNGQIGSRMSTGRRPSYASVSREGLGKGKGAITLKRVMFDEEEGTAADGRGPEKKLVVFGAPELRTPGARTLNPASVLQSSPMAAHSKAAATAQHVKAQEQMVLLQDDHEFYHALDQMTSYSGSALLIVLELCKPFFTCLYSIAATVSGFYELHSRERADHIRRMFAELQSMVFQVFQLVLMDHAFSGANIQMVLTRYLNSTAHMAVHMRAGLMAFLHFVTTIDRLYGQCPSLRVSQTSTNLKELRRHSQTLTAYSAIVKVLYDSGSLTDQDCQVLSGYSSGSYSQHISDLLATTGLEADSLYQRSARTSNLALALALRERAQGILFAMLEVFASELSRPQSKWEPDATHLLSKATSLSGMQACCSVLKSLSDLKTLYLGSRKPHWALYLDQVYSVAYLQGTAAGFVKTVSDLQGVTFVSGGIGENSTTLQELLADIRSYLIGMVLELVMVTKPLVVRSSARALSLSTDHRRMLREKKAVLTDFFTNQVLQTALRAARSLPADRRRDADGARDLLRLGMDEPQMELMVSQREGQWCRELLEVLAAILFSSGEADGRGAGEEEELEEVRCLYRALFAQAALCSHAAQAPPSTRRTPLTSLSALLQLHGVASRVLYWFGQIASPQGCRNAQEAILPIMQEALEDELLRLTPSRASSRNPAVWNQLLGLGPQAFLSFMLFYSCRATADAPRSLIDDLREKELQHLRDCLSSLLASGYWELGATIAAQYRSAHGAEKASTAVAWPGHGSALGTPQPRALKSSPSRRQLSQFFPADLTSPRPGMARPRSFFSAPPQGATPHPPPGDVSPQRAETIKSELGRVLGKLEDKLKHEGALRTAPLHYAVRLVSTAPFQVDAALLASLAEDAWQCVEMQRCNLTDLQARALGAEEMQWFEEWLVLRFDVSSCAAAAAGYQEYLRALRRQALEDHSAEMGDLGHPLSFHRLQAQVSQHLPDFTLVPSHVNLEAALAAVPVASAALAPARYVQCFVAHPAEVCRQAHDVTLYCEPLMRVKERLLAHKLEAHSDDEGDRDAHGDGDSSDEDDDADALIDSSNLDDLLEMRSHSRDAVLDLGSDAGRWRIRRGLDKQFVSFTRLPADFFVYSGSGLVDEGRDVCRYTLAVQQYSVPVEGIVGPTAVAGGATSVRFAAQNGDGDGDGDDEGEGAEGGGDANGDDKVAFGARGGRSREATALLVSSAALCPLNLAVHVASADISSLEACTEILLHVNTTLARVYRGMKHCNSLTGTEIANQPAGSLLHTDHLFQAAFCTLANLLAAPAATCVGLTNVDDIIARERERVEGKWQDMRKLAKREYMREVSVFEQSTRDLLRVKGAAALAKPQEPDLYALKAAFDQQAGLDRVDLLQQHRDLAWGRCGKICKEMRKFVEKLAGQGEEPDAAAAIAIKTKMCLHLDALFFAADLGLGL